MFLTTGLTNARTEGTNRLIKQVKRAACDSRSRARSSSRRLAQVGSVVRPRRSNRSRVTRWRTAVTALLASMIRWKWSTAMAASGRAARTAAA